MSGSDSSALARGIVDRIASRLKRLVAMGSVTFLTSFGGFAIHVVVVRLLIQYEVVDEQQ